MGSPRNLIRNRIRNILLLNSPLYPIVSGILRRELISF